MRNKYKKRNYTRMAVLEKEGEKNKITSKRGIRSWSPIQVLIAA